MSTGRLANSKYSHSFLSQLGHDNLDEGSTPLMIAFVNDKNFEPKTKKMADLLLNYGADVNQKTEKGMTILHLAVKENAYPWVNYLIQNKADLEARNETGQTPIDLSSNAEMSKILNSAKEAIKASTLNAGSVGFCHK